MSLESLQAKARKDQVLMERVAVWRRGNSWRSFAAYLYWRNRYPVLTEVLSRSLLFAEIYLLYRFFHLHTAASLSFILFWIFFFRGIFNGTLQAFRVAITTEALRTDRARANKQFPVLLRLATIAGIALPTVLLLGSLYFATDPLSVAFGAIWIVILPLQLHSASWWMLVYTRNRLRRDFWTIAVCRFVPLFALVVLHRILGPYAYVLGVLIGRVLENLYLINCARSELINQGVPIESIKRPLSHLRQVSRQPGFYSHAFFPLPYQIYNLVLGAAILFRDPQWWLIHFVFFYLVISFSYPVLRISQSLAMDIFLALKAGDLTSARFYLRRIEISVTVLLVSIIAGLTLSFFGQTALFTLRGQILYQLWVYFLGAIAARSLFQSYITIYRAAGTEHSYNWILSFLLIGLVLPLQVFVLLYLRGNLPFVYAIDIACFFTLALILKTKNTFSTSDIYNGGISRVLKIDHLLPPKLWLQYFGLFKQVSSKYQLMILQLDHRYRSVSFEHALLKKIAENLSPDSICTPILPGIYLYTLSEDGSSNAEEIADNITRKLSGHVRSVHIVDSASPFEKSFKSTLAVLGKVRNPSRRSRALLKRANSVVGNDEIYRTIERLRKYSFSQEIAKNAISALQEMLSSSGLGNIPCIF